MYVAQDPSQASEDCIPTAFALPELHRSGKEET